MIEQNQGTSDHDRAVESIRNNELSEAAEILARCLDRDADDARALNTMAAVQGLLHDDDFARRLVRRALELDPTSHEIRFNHGSLLQRAGDLDAAARVFSALHAENPDDGATAVKCVELLVLVGEMVRANQILTVGIKRDPMSAHVLFELSRQLQQLDRREDAEAMLRFLAPWSGNPAVSVNLSAILFERCELAQARELLVQAIELMERQETIDTERLGAAHNNLGAVLQEQGQRREALVAFERAAELLPPNPEIEHNLATMLQMLGEVDRAIEHFEQAIALDPGSGPTAAGLVYAQRMLCHWNDLASREEALIEQVQQGVPGIMPFVLIGVSDSPALQLQCARQWVEFKTAATTRGTRRSTGAAPVCSGGCPLRIGYLSRDFREGVVASLIAGLIEDHDRARVHVTAYSHGRADDSKMGRRLREGFDEFRDIADMSHAAAAALIEADGIDVLVDLKGFTEAARTEIPSLRPAPVQVRWLGHAGTTGASFIDYLIADAVAVPASMQPFYSEALVHMPRCYQINDPRRVVAEEGRTREDWGLPDDGFVFCSFNASYKITPGIFDVWMDILREVEGSRLWLLAISPTMIGNLRREAASRGIDADRLVFGGFVEHARHLARYHVADLFLDTPAINACASATDALHEGCPVLTVEGRTFASRAATSVLTAAGMQRFVAASLEEYRDLAISFARDEKAQDDTRSELLETVPHGSLFDTRAFAADLETAFERMVRRQRSGLPPEPFGV